MTTNSTYDQHVFLAATAARQEHDIVPTTRSDVEEHEDRLSGTALRSSHAPRAPAFGAAGGRQDEVILIPTDSESEPMSESDGETDEDVASLMKINERINEEITTPAISISPASTMTTVVNTPRASLLGSEVLDHSSASIQRSPSPTFIATSVPPGQGSRDRLDSSRHSAGTSTEIAAPDHGQMEGASEPLTRQGDNHEPGAANLPRPTAPHGSASQSDLVSTDGDGKIAADGDSDSCGDSCNDSDGGNDGDDDDYDDDGGSSDTDDEDGNYSKRRAIDRTPSASRSDSDHVDSPADGNAEEKPARSCKRQKVTHDRASTLRRPNAMPRSAGRLSRSRGRSQTAAMPSPPASHNLSETESDKGSDCSSASTASFGEWLLHNAALKCVTIDGVATYQLQFQRAPMHSCSRLREGRAHTFAKKSKSGRKPRNETKGRRCGVCTQTGHNARTCPGGTGKA